jgi:hypothetical protein
MGLGPSSPFLEPFQWSIETDRYFHISPTFIQERENFVAFLDRSPIHDSPEFRSEQWSLYIYCCSAGQWQYDESFLFSVEVSVAGETFTTASTFTKQSPFCCVVLHSYETPVDFLIGVHLCSTYPYTRRDGHLGIRNSGSTCYMATILQILFHTGAFREYVYSLRDPGGAAAALQQLFVHLQLSPRAPTLDTFIRSLGSFRDLAFVQNDANEFLIVIFERFEHDLGERFAERMRELFGGATRKRIWNDEKGFCAEQHEAFMSLPVPVDGLRSLTESLRLMTAKEPIEGYDAGDLGRISVNQMVSFLRLPPILVLHLCRFQFSTVKKQVIELRTRFDCPYELDMSDFAPGIPGETQYELYAVCAHSGNPVFGHYTSYIRCNLSDRWTLFNDNSTKVVDQSAVGRLFGAADQQPSFFKAFQFNSAVAYMLFYVRKDRQADVIASADIAGHLAPHRSAVFHGRFLTSGDVIGRPLTPDIPPVEWTDPKKPFGDLSPEEVDLSRSSIWVQMPGTTRLLGPVWPSADLPSTFVVQGHITCFYLLSTSVTIPLFLASEKPPRVCLDIIDGENPPERPMTYQKRKFAGRSAPPGGFLESAEEDSALRHFEIGKQQLAFAASATYFDVQRRLSLLYNIDPNRILLLSASGPMKPRAFRFIRNFPAGGPLSFQILESPATVLSISLYTPLRIVYFAPSSVHHRATPAWVPKGTTCREIILGLSKFFPDAPVVDKGHFQCSIDRRGRVERLLDGKAAPMKENIRVDWVGHDIVATRSALKKRVTKGLKFAMEIVAGDHSKFLSIGNKMTFRDVCRKLSTMFPVAVGTGGTLFVHEKPKIRMPIVPDAAIFDVLKGFVAKMTRQGQRVCLDISVEAPVRVPVRTISLSGLLHAETHGEGPVP